MFRNPYIESVKKVFERSPRMPLLLAGRLLPPQLHFLLRFLAFKGPGLGPLKELRRQMEEAVESRKKDKRPEGRSVDFIDLFLEAEADLDLTANSNFDMKNPMKVERKLTEGEIRGNLFLFLLAGLSSSTKKYRL